MIIFYLLAFMVFICLVFALLTTHTLRDPEMLFLCFMIIVLIVAALLGD